MLTDPRWGIRVLLAGGPPFSNTVLGVFVPHQFSSATNFLSLYLLTNTRQHACILHALERFTSVMEM